jgi:hypothetical protein
MPDLRLLVRATLATSRTDLSNMIINEEITMLASLLIPYIPMDDAAAISPGTAIMLAQAETKSGTQPMYELRGSCNLEESPFTEGPTGFSSTFFPVVIHPTHVVAQYFQKYLEPVKGSDTDIAMDFRGAKVSVVEMPRHGTLEPFQRVDNYDLTGPGFIYNLPSRDWLGADQLTALVELGKLAIRVKMDIVVVRMIDDRNGFSHGFSGGGEELDAIANECKWRGYNEIERVWISGPTEIPSSEDKEEEEDEWEGYGASTSVPF